MPQLSTVANPFLLMLQPEAVIAAVERSERLGALNRHLCRPLDRLPRGGEAASADEAEGDGADALGDALSAGAAGERRDPQA